MFLGWTWTEHPSIQLITEEAIYNLWILTLTLTRSRARGWLLIPCIIIDWILVPWWSKSKACSLTNAHLLTPGRKKKGFKIPLFSPTAWYICYYNNQGPKVGNKIKVFKKGRRRRLLSFIQARCFAEKAMLVCYAVMFVLQGRLVLSLFADRDRQDSKKNNLSTGRGHSRS